MDMEILPWEVPDPGLQGPPRHWSQKGVLLAYPSSKVYVTKTNEITMWSRTSTEAAVQALSSPLCHYNIILLYQESTIFYCQHWGCFSDSGCCLSSGCCIDSSCSSDSGCCSSSGCCTDSGCCLSSGCCIDSSCSSDSGCCSSSGSCSDSKGCEKVQVCLGSVLMWLYRSRFDMYLICIRMAFFKKLLGLNRILYGGLRGGIMKHKVLIVLYRIWGGGPRKGGLGEKGWHVSVNDYSDTTSLV